MPPTLFRSEHSVFVYLTVLTRLGLRKGTGQLGAETEQKEQREHQINDPIYKWQSLRIVNIQRSQKRSDKDFKKRGRGRNVNEMMEDDANIKISNRISETPSFSSMMTDCFNIYSVYNIWKSKQIEQGKGGSKFCSLKDLSKQCATKKTCSQVCRFFLFKICSQCLCNSLPELCSWSPLGLTQRPLCVSI